jgi:hypothetical protein
MSPCLPSYFILSHVRTTRFYKIKQICISRLLSKEGLPLSLQFFHLNRTGCFLRCSSISKAFPLRSIMLVCVAACLNAVGQQYVDISTASSQLSRVTFTFFYVTLLGWSNSDRLIPASAESCFMYKSPSQRT